MKSAVGTFYPWQAGRRPLLLVLTGVPHASVLSPEKLRKLFTLFAVVDDFATFFFALGFSVDLIAIALAVAAINLRPLFSLFRGLGFMCHSPKSS